MNLEDPGATPLILTNAGSFVILITATEEQDLAKANIGTAKHSHAFNELFPEGLS